MPKKDVLSVEEVSDVAKPYLDAAKNYLDRVMSAKDNGASARFTGIEEIALITAGVEVVKILLKILAVKLENSNGSDVDAMKQVLQSIKETIELERKIEEAQNAIKDNDVNLNDWTNDGD